MSEWSFIIAAYAVTWVALAAYVAWLGARERTLKHVPLDLTED